MAKKKNYEELISTIEQKIADRKEQVKKLEAQLKELREEQSAEKNRELLRILDERNISAQDAINVLNERFPG
ncbi:MAG: protein kinase [Selenomonadaceae bacterium]|nr:protein kinase [Selenomonadaceae bacterium]MBR0283766.1 protein kinase [Selenomonadaceae bacterium]MBR6342414.1 protein kinase [Selenomonadaceae bacterium]MBR6905999.1 protein kinase [Selenomonadaceae bacterium]